MRRCPKCNSDDIHRSRPKSMWEEWRKEVTGKQPYRCQSCGWRGWDFSFGPQFDYHDVESAARALAPDPPNLKGTALAHSEVKAPELNLTDLDTLAPIRPKEESEDEGS